MLGLCKTSLQTNTNRLQQYNCKPKKLELTKFILELIRNSVFGCSLLELFLGLEDGVQWSGIASHQAVFQQQHNHIWRTPCSRKAPLIGNRKTELLYIHKILFLEFDCCRASFNLFYSLKPPRDWDNHYCELHINSNTDKELWKIGYNNLWESTSYNSRICTANQVSFKTNKEGIAAI